MRRVLGIIAVCAVGSSAYAQQWAPAIGGSTGGGGGFVDSVVYDNSATLLGSLIIGIDEEWGDGVTLAGTDRVVTNINLLVHANRAEGATADMRVRIFAGGDLGGGDPGAMLWDSGVVAGVVMPAGTAPFDFAVPNVLVPDEITWTLELTNVDAGGVAVGSRFVSPPSVGSSEEWVWQRDGGVWDQVVIAGLPDFGATITAVPTPGSIGLLALSGVIVLRRRR